MCYVNISQFRANIAHFIELSKTEEVLITQNGKVVSLLCNPEDKFVDDFRKLAGCLSPFDKGESYEEIITEEILKK